MENKTVNKQRPRYIHNLQNKEKPGSSCGKMIGLCGLVKIVVMKTMKP